MVLYFAKNEVAEQIAPTTCGINTLNKNSSWKESKAFW
jgi:hypothetical protein